MMRVGSCVTTLRARHGSTRISVLPRLASTLTWTASNSAGGLTELTSAAAAIRLWITSRDASAHLTRLGKIAGWLASSESTSSLQRKSSALPKLTSKHITFPVPRLSRSPKTTTNLTATGGGPGPLQKASTRREPFEPSQSNPATSLVPTARFNWSVTKVRAFSRHAALQVSATPSLAARWCGYLLHFLSCFISYEASEVRTRSDACSAWTGVGPATHRGTTAVPSGRLDANEALALETVNDSWVRVRGHCQSAESTGSS